MRGAHAPAAAGAAGHPGAVPRHVPSLRRRRSPIATRWPRADGLNLINLRAAEPTVGLWQTESTEACCARHKVEPLFSRARRLRRLVHGAAPRSVAVAGESAGSRAVHAAERQTPSRKVSPLAALDDARCVAVREGPRHPAAAALRARLHQHRLRAVHVRCRSIRTTRDRAAGRARSSSAGSISSRQ